MDFYHRTNYDQSEPVNKAILIFNENDCLVFVMMQVGMFFVMASIEFCLEGGLIYCDCNNIFDVPSEATSFCKLFL
jgi:hypothetical protein